MMFRAWSKNEKKYIYDFCMTNSGIIINKVYSHENYIIEQSTGLKDKNGVEIYEGDIVKRYNGIDFKMYLVGWSIDNMYAGVCPCALYITHGEVIGNIHENPELVVEN